MYVFPQFVCVFPLPKSARSQPICESRQPADAFPDPSYECPEPAVPQPIDMYPDATDECAEPVFGLPVSPDQREKKKKIEVLLDATEGIFEATEGIFEASEVFFEASEAFLEIINRAERGKNRKNSDSYDTGSP